MWQLLGLINDVLDFNQIEAQEFKLKNDWFCLTDAIDLCMEILGHRVTTKNGALVMRYTMAPGTPAEIYGAENQLRQVAVFLFFFMAIRLTRFYVH